MSSKHCPPMRSISRPRVYNNKSIGVIAVDFLRSTKYLYGAANDKRNTQNSVSKV